MRRFLALLAICVLLALAQQRGSISQEGGKPGHRFFPCRLCHLKQPTVADPALRDDIESRCLTCHTERANRPMDHPRVSMPNGRAQLAPELPLGPRGEITCVTCHDPHPWSPSRFYMRDYNPGTDDWSDLCRRCHTTVGVN